MALISEGVSHAGFGGLSLALLIGYYIPALGNEFWSRVITGLFCLGTALLIGYFARSRRVHEDSAIGILLVGSVALGDVLIHFYANLPHDHVVRTDVENLLFGSFSAVNFSDMVTSVSTAVVCFLIVGVLYWQFLYTTLDEEMARVNGVNTRLVNLLLMTMISLVIVINVRMVGFLMITAMTIIPGATANMISRRFGGVLAIAIALGVAGTVAALLLVSNTDLRSYPSGPFIVLALFAIFTITWVVRHHYKPKPQPGVPHDAAHGH
jgi:zinc transport system permease protein